MRKLMLLAVAPVALIVASPAAAQENGSRQTRDFVHAAGESDTLEILEAQAVLAQSTDPQVRAFAQQMLQAHSATRVVLEAAATRAGLRPPPKSLGSDQSLLLNALQSQHGPAFDKMYVRHQALAHRSALTTAQLYAATGDQPNIRAAAASAMPVIASHLAMAEQMQAKSGE
jgi:putative membrane protein